MNTLEQQHPSPFLAMSALALLVTAPSLFLTFVLQTVLAPARVAVELASATEPQQALSALGVMLEQLGLGFVFLVLSPCCFVAGVVLGIVWLVKRNLAANGKPGIHRADPSAAG